MTFVQQLLVLAGSGLQSLLRGFERDEVSRILERPLSLWPQHLCTLMAEV